MKNVSRHTVITVILTFLLGFAAGMALRDVVAELPLPFAVSSPDFDHELDDALEREKRVLRGLGLSADQRQRVDEAFTRRENTLVDYWATRIPDMQRIIESSRTELRTILTTEQRKQFDKDLAEVLGPADAARD